MNIILMLLNLNTSHVKVNLLFFYRFFIFYLYLNTSHVKVNQTKEVHIADIGINLNTSHVKVNQYGHGTGTGGWVFKYILC